MAIVRAQCSFMLDSALPRDRCVIDPVFDISDGVFTNNTDLPDLCNDLAEALDQWSVATQEVMVKLYDVHGTQPVFPAATSIQQTGTISNSSAPREIALCLSFYAEHNVPRQRGRVYVPAALCSTGAPGVRPSSTYTDKLVELASIFTNLGSTDTDWVVYSKVDDEARSVTNWWIDNEWDTIRSRGTRPTSRITGTTTEA